MFASNCCSDMGDITLTIGAMEIGVAVATFLTGMVVVQTWNYFRDFEDDALATKILVGSVCFGDHQALESIVWSMQWSLTFVWLTTFAIRVRTPQPFPHEDLTKSHLQTWFSIFRIYRLCGMWIVSLACWILSLAACALAISCNVLVWLNPVFTTAATPLFRGQIIGLFCTSAAADMVIAAIMCRKMNEMRSGSGLLTSIGSVTEVVIYQTMENSLCFVLAKLLSNSLLASLNGRKKHRQQEFDVSLNWDKSLSA
ncbi:hypothetical protein EXIGLDRAFT_691636 [Exidia glandulosa HHB12029]|uniref:Transmembrane protein n=1 Tax=Exidia glandulosa HHB12029 TaxID=1314781 RepID=A0A165IIB0_EXIGL|nr:hypothetical protein EXIGLDRAFT_691636 [Exidia glandulosa HHB12029]